MCLSKGTIQQNWICRVLIECYSVCWFAVGSKFKLVYVYMYSSLCIYLSPSISPLIVSSVELKLYEAWAGCFINKPPHLPLILISSEYPPPHPAPFIIQYSNDHRYYLNDRRFTASPPPCRVHRVLFCEAWLFVDACICISVLYTYLIPVSNDAACILVFCRGGVICGLHPCEPNKCHHPKLFFLSSNWTTTKSGVMPARMAFACEDVYSLGLAYIQ
jgi:hypothetical protein